MLDIKKYKEAAEEEYFEYKLGLRVLPLVAQKYEIGESMDKSMDWQDDVCSGFELSGACCISLDHPNALEFVKQYHSGLIYVVVGNSGSAGQDVGEIIISDPVVLDIINN